MGATANASTFLQPETLMIIGLGLFAFCFSTVGGFCVIPAYGIMLGNSR